MKMCKTCITTWRNTTCLLLMTLALVSGFCNRATAQSPDTVRFDYLSFYVFGQVAVPAKEFREVINNSVGNTGVGLAGGFLFSPFGQKKPSPILLGFDYSYQNYGVEKFDIPSFDSTIKVSHNIHTFNAVARLRPTNQHNRKVTPFADGMLGLKLYNTRVKVDKNLIDAIFNTDGESLFESVKNTGLNFGLGGGFYTCPKYAGVPGFTIRVMYLWGDEVDYVVRNSVKYVNDSFTYQTDRANTSMLLIQIGVTGFSWSKTVN